MSGFDESVKFCSMLLLWKQVIIFSSEGSSLAQHRDIPLVALPGVDDSYPPQHKSFAMLRYMYDHYRDKFRFFMRADDDVYIHTDVLRPFLHSVNSTNRRLFIGQVQTLRNLSCYVVTNVWSRVWQYRPVCWKHAAEAVTTDGFKCTPLSASHT